MTIRLSGGERQRLREATIERNPAAFLLGQ